MRPAKYDKHRQQTQIVDQLHLHAVPKAKLNVFEVVHACCCKFFPRVIVDIVLSYNPHISVCLIHYKQDLYKNVFGDVFVGDKNKNQWYKLKRKFASKDSHDSQDTVFYVDPMMYNMLPGKNILQERREGWGLNDPPLHEEFDGTRLEYHPYGFGTVSLWIGMKAYYRIEVLINFNEAFFDRTSNSVYGIISSDFAVVDIRPQENIKNKNSYCDYRAYWHAGSQKIGDLKQGKWGITRNYIVALSSQTISWIAKHDLELKAKIYWNEGNPWSGNNSNIVCFKDEIYFTTNKEIFYMKEPTF